MIILSTYCRRDISTFRSTESLLQIVFSCSASKKTLRREYFVVTEWNLSHCVCMARSMANPYTLASAHHITSTGVVLLALVDVIIC